MGTITRSIALAPCVVRHAMGTIVRLVWRVVKHGNGPIVRYGMGVILMDDMGTVVRHGIR